LVHEGVARGQGRKGEAYKVSEFTKLPIKKGGERYHEVIKGGKTLGRERSLEGAKRRVKPETKKKWAGQNGGRGL